MKTDTEDETAKAHPPDFVLELLHAGEGAGRVTETWRNHAEGCARCASKVAAWGEHAADYRASPQARNLRDLLTTRERAPAPVQGRRARPRAFAHPLWWLGLTAAAAAGLIGILVVRAPEPGGDLRIKGHGELRAVVRRAGQTSRWDGGPLRPTDEVQLAWAGPTAGFLVVLAHETDGEAIVLFPEHGGISGAVAAGRDHAIGASLNITRGSRPFIATACFSVAPVRVDAFARSARRGAGTADACPGETHVLSFAVQTP